jgi:hypothetical protein
MKRETLADHVKALHLQPHSILVVDANKVRLRQLADVRLDADFRVPVLPVDGTPSIELLTRDQLVEALRLIDERA